MPRNPVLVVLFTALLACAVVSLVIVYSASVSSSIALTTPRVMTWLSVGIVSVMAAYVIIKPPALVLRVIAWLQHKNIVP